MHTETTPTAHPTTVEEYTAQQLRRRMLTVAEDLEHLAKTVRNRITDLDHIGKHKHSTYAWTVSRLHQEITTTLLNLHIGGLIVDASAADVARASGE